MRRLATVLLVAHAVALVFGLAGMLIALPNPHLWADSPLGVQAFTFGMQYAGSLHIVLGAAALYAFGWAVLGPTRAAIFLVSASVLSAGSELVGTGTGWPFGNYEYTEGLGAKLLGRVPFSIPLSWFYMGLTSYLLALALVRTRGLKHTTAWSLGLGAYFLTVWDLVLDPAMAHESLPIQFWVWHQTGPYFGMPIQNFVGWTATGLAFMALSRWLWRREPPLERRDLWLPLAVYTLNMGWAMVLSLAAGLAAPVLITAVLALAPLLLLVRPSTGASRLSAEPA